MSDRDGRPLLLRSRFWFAPSLDFLAAAADEFLRGDAADETFTEAPEHWFSTPSLKTNFKSIDHAVFGNV